MIRNETVIDSSAIIALAKGEPGSRAIVPEFLPQGVISAVNIAEFVQVLRRLGMDPQGYLREFEEAGLTTIPAVTSHAVRAGELEHETRRWGLSLADRFCIALAQERNLPVLTTDRIWQEAGLGVEVILARDLSRAGR